LSHIYVCVCDTPYTCTYTHAGTQKYQRVDVIVSEGGRQRDRERERECEKCQRIDIIVTHTHTHTHTHKHKHTQIEVSAHIDGCMEAVAHTLIVGDAVNNKSTR
jgi:calcineurin-like phosphoesterase family protein